jgi:hypothetical protein
MQITKLYLILFQGALKAKLFTKECIAVNLKPILSNTKYHSQLQSDDRPDCYMVTL